ncbi:MAG: chromosome segregation protein SMC [Alphaproteobacteria bacterium]|nr:chromosome segregation protein SMC [Alphaproteobacteria bacterium]
MHFSKLHLHGFKSFVEPTDLLIDNGLTGIVGPNGCGKSNLVEALRWVMGETSPKRMRGSGMDDVIFGGTATRPARNLGEVSLSLDNTQRSATAEFNDTDELVVTRKIEREAGSEYRVNGRPVRQRDIQLLFADQATGAHSTSLVGQGQIDALIRAKPQDRRQILEEASGTAGLQARRHEAELKLKGAEQNLTRVDDVLAALDTQLRGLKQQVRQASRYRNLAEHIRRTEAALMHLRWTAGQEQLEQNRAALQQAEQAANEFLAVVTRGNTDRTEAAAGLPGLRQAEAAAAAVVQRLTLKREQLESEAKRLADDTATQEQRLTEAQQDHAREQGLRSDADAATERLQREGEQLEKKLGTLTALQPSLAASLETIDGEVAALQDALDRLTEEVANAEARRTTLTREIEQLTGQQKTLQQRRTELEQQRDVLAAESGARPELALAQSMLAATEADFTKRQAANERAETFRKQAEQTLETAQQGARAADAHITKLQAEAGAIKTLLADTDQDGEKLIDVINVAPGFEAALASALGEALTAPVGAHKAAHWRDLPAYDNPQPLPAGAAPLAAQITAPEALARSLSQIGLVNGTEQGDALAAQLKPGQILVSREGWAWRWDGYTVTPETPTAYAVRLKQRNRLAALEGDIAEAEAAASGAREALEMAESTLGEYRREVETTRQAMQQSFAALNDARRNYSEKAEAAAAANSKLAALEDALLHANHDLGHVTERMEGAARELEIARAVETRRPEIDRQRAALTEKRARQTISRSELDRITHELTALRERAETVTSETASWQQRSQTAFAKLDELATRIMELEESLIGLRQRPAAIASERSALLDQLGEAETLRGAAAEKLMTAETALAEVEQKLKRDEAALAGARENRVRYEAGVQAAEEHLKDLQERITEKLDCTADQLLQVAELAEGETAPDMRDLEDKLARHLRERDNMGPVNLRAEVESDTVQGEIDRLQAEKDDLVAAIAKLRQGISQLNKEARERLQNAFVSVNEKFQALFQRLFAGGRAHLELIDDEDPLNAGLEIFAAPPGKKVQVLSLLSGGERTLTALALLFAVFQTNPSPICVLDEAEAALDESNVDRFCKLVREVATETKTRFLIITHQRLTMARMDRLFGVTMMEKGVSQLVSVNLSQAEAIRDGEVPENIDDLVAAE